MESVIFKTVAENGAFRLLFPQPLLRPVSSTRVEKIILCFIDFFALLSARFNFKREKINNRNKECFFPRS